jgi:hypothetical protein
MQVFIVRFLTKHRGNINFISLDTSSNDITVHSIVISITSIGRLSLCHKATHTLHMDSSKDGPKDFVIGPVARK